jgi:dephospho-CoA kinase
MSAAPHAKSMVVMLTGGIGSGKTTVSDRFARLGVDVIDSDIASRTIMEPGRPAYVQVVERYGTTILQPDGAIDRAALRKRVFSDPAERRWLEVLTHPLIGVELKRGVDEARPPYCIFVVPLFDPRRRHPLADRILVVDASEHVQLRRTMERDANSEAQVRAIMAAQAGRTDRLAAADEVIVNDGSVEELDAQVAALDAKYRRLGSEFAAARAASAGGE